MADWIPDTEGWVPDSQNTEDYSLLPGELQGVDEKPLQEAKGSLLSGAASWIPAGLSMFSFDTRSLPERAETAKAIQEELTYTPTTKEGQDITSDVAYPLTWMKEKGDESGAIYDQWALEADDRGDKKTAETYRALAGVSRFGGEAAPFALPFVSKGVRSVKNVAKRIGEEVKSMGEMVGEEPAPPTLRPPPTEQIVETAPPKPIETPIELPKPEEMKIETTPPKEPPLDALVPLEEIIEKAKSLSPEDVTKLKESGIIKPQADFGVLGKEPTIESPFNAGPGAKTAGALESGEDIVKQRNTGTKDEPLLQPAVKRSEYESIKALPKIAPTMSRALTLGENLTEAKPLGGKTETPPRTFDFLGEPAKEMFLYPIREAWHKYKADHKVLMDDFDNVSKGLPDKSMRNIGSYAISLQENGPAILANMKRDIPVLSEKERAVYDHIREKFEDLYTQLQFAREQAGLKPFAKVDNYFTFFRDYEMMRELGFNPMEMDSLKFKEIADMIHAKATGFRFAKERGEWKAPVELDARKVFTLYTDYATKHINLSPPISKGRELISDYKIKDVKDVKLPTDKTGQGLFDFAQTQKVIDESMFSLKESNPTTHKFLQDWLDYTAGQKPSTNLPPVIESGLKMLNRNIPAAVLTWNLRSALIQPVAILPTMVEIGVNNTLKGVAALMKGEGEYALKHSKHLLAADFDIAYTDMAHGFVGKVGKARHLATEYGIAPLKYLDMLTRKATWLGAFRSVEGKMNFRDAVRYADDITVRTQGSATPFEISPAQRTTLGKTLSLFQTFNINQWGWITKDVMGIRNPNMTTPEAIKKTAAFIVGVTLVNSLFESGLGLNSPFPAPIHEYLNQKKAESSDAKALFNASLEYLSLPPYLGGMRYGYLPFGPVGDVVRQTGTLLKEQRPPAPIEVAEFTGKILGMPGATQLKKSVKAYQQGQTPYEIITGARMTPEEYKAYKKRRQRESSGKTNNLRSLRGSLK